MSPKELERQMAELAVLAEPVRRSLYLYVAGRRQEVSRDEAAEAVGTSHALAGFHLDRLAAEGLLETSYRRLSGRTGPGAGRPSKLYRRSGEQIAFSLPQRSYELAARILAAAVEEAGSARRVLEKTARAMGRAIGAGARARAGSRPGKQRLVASAVAALASHGYEPRLEGGAIQLHNCPFHAIASEHRDVVCAMNLALVRGIVEGLDLTGARPVLDAKPGRCCVCVELGKKRPAKY